MYHLKNVIRTKISKNGNCSMCFYSKKLDMYSPISAS
nr:MAG TPA: hypothetical protein [Bacteriophage sp.]